MKTEITGAKFLNEDGTWIDDSLVIEGPRILGTWKTGKRILDASNCLLLPGIVDLHGDGFERLIMPRPSAVLPYETGFMEADRQITASGITTAFFSMTYTWEEHDALRCDSGARMVLEAFHEVKHNLHCDPKLHLRFEIYHLAGLKTVHEWLERGNVDLLAFNDHLSHQEEKINNKGMLNEIAAKYKLSPEATLAKINEVRNSQPKAIEGVENLARKARDLDIVMASHDEEEPEVRQWYHQRGCTLCEFPCNEKTAKEALRLGDQVILGAPNAIRGKSLYERLSVRKCVSDESVTILSSDYYYPSQLQAVFLMADMGLAPIEKMWPLISGNAAKAAGLHDRGVIKEGMRADLILVDKPAIGPPSVVATFVGGELVYASRSFFARNRYAA